MPISCVPSDLAAAAKCYCGPTKVQLGEMVVLLQAISGDTSTPAELAQKAACYTGSTEKVLWAEITYLLCAIASA